MFHPMLQNICEVICKKQDLIKDVFISALQLSTIQQPTGHQVNQKNGFPCYQHFLLTVFVSFRDDMMYFRDCIILFLIIFLFCFLLVVLFFFDLDLPASIWLKLEKIGCFLTWFSLMFLYGLLERNAHCKGRNKLIVSNSLI